MVITLTETLAIVLASAIAIPICVLFCQYIAAVTGRRWLSPEGERPSLAVVVPAHDEETVIVPTLRNISQQLRPTDQLVVVADNCTDATAKLAGECGAVVLERTNTELRGKGYALAHAIEYLEASPPEVMIVIDADTIVGTGSLDHLATTVAATRRPAQAIYLLSPPESPSARDLISQFAFLVKNLVRPIGMANLGLPCQLTGSGMGFPWPLVSSELFASGDLVEDLQLGIHLNISGNPPQLCPAARVTGTLPSKADASFSQRTRWEHGYLRTMLVECPRLWHEAIKQKRFDLLLFSLDLAVPPLALLCLMWLITMIFAAALSYYAGILVPTYISLVSGVALFCFVICSWVTFAKTIVPIVSLAKVPGYLLWKIPLYLAFVFKRQTRWIRTDRDHTQQTPQSSVAAGVSAVPPKAHIAVPITAPSVPQAHSTTKLPDDVQ